MTDQTTVVPEGLKPFLQHLASVYKAASVVNATAAQHDQLRNSVMVVEKQLIDSYSEPEKESDTTDGSEHEEQQV